MLRVIRFRPGTTGILSSHDALFFQGTTALPPPHDTGFRPGTSGPEALMEADFPSRYEETASGISYLDGKKPPLSYLDGKALAAARIPSYLDGNPSPAISATVRAPT